MAAYRSYSDVIAIIESFGIEFTGKSQKPYRKTRSAFASRARYWGDQRLSEELRYMLSKQRRREQYQDLRKMNVSTKEAKRGASLSRQNFNRYEMLRKYFGDDKARRLLKQPDKIDTAIKRVMEKPIRTIRDKTILNDRDTTWAYWSHLRNHPDYYRDLAYKINQEDFNNDPDAKPGWAVAYYHYKYGIATEDIIANTQISEFMDDAYVTVVQHLL